MLRFVLHHIRFQNWDASPNFLVELKKRANIWGVWRGVFGLSSRECIVICPEGDSDQSFVAPDGTEVIKSVNLSSTARPQSSAPLTQSGLYVFRTFEIDRENIEAAVDLSARGWLYFEDQPDFAAQPIALFEVDLKTSSYLLLITWYRDFSSWERSREPDPEATKNFVARQKLTHSTLAIATRLWEG